MSLCDLEPEILQQQIGGLPTEECLATVPDIQASYSFGGSLQQGCKRYRSSSDCLSGEEDLALLGQDQQKFESLAFPELKRHCNYDLTTTSPDQIQFGKVFIEEVSSSYCFGSNEEIDVLTCGGDSPVNITALNFSSSSRGSTDCQQIQAAFVPINFLSNMQQPPTVISQVAQPTEKFEVVITEQPEEYYRARYNSEGVRAPLKGMTENYPTVQVFGPEFRFGRIDVKLVHGDGTPHTSCSLDTSEGRKNAVSKKIGPFNRMIAEFEDLRIRRVKKEGRKKTTNTEKSTPKDGRSDKVASLLFTATIETDHGEIVQSIQSKPISLTTAPEPAELDWLEPNRGHFAGQEPIVIKGSKMTSPKVTFRILLPGGRRQELHGSVDKERSHQNVLLVKTPSLNQLSYQFAHQRIRAEVVVVTGRNQMSSNALQFDFIPNHICRECMQETQPTHMTPYSVVCSPPPQPTVPSYLPASKSGHSPPHTPGLAPTQPSPSPSAVRPQIQLSGQQPSYSQSIPPSPLPVTSETMPSPSSSSNLLSSPDMGTTSGKSGDDIMYIMRDLMGQECSSNTANVNVICGKDIESHFLYGQIEGHMQQAASPYIPVTSPSAASDQPCYSPVTPVQSPPTSTPWNYIERMLTSLLRNDQITRDYFRVLQEECVKQNPYLLQAFNTSQSNEGVFLQLLASHKPDQSSFQATRQ